jgi:hypothetical protein
MSGPTAPAAATMTRASLVGLGKAERRRANAAFTVSPAVRGSRIGSEPRNCPSVSRAVISLRASGLPAVLSCRRAMTASDTAPFVTARSSAPESASSSPRRSSVSMPEGSKLEGSPALSANSSTRPSAAIRRAVKDRAWADAGSSQCASSTVTSRGPSSAAAASRFNVPAKTIRGCGDDGGPSASAAPSASACGSGMRSSRAINGHATPERPEYGILDSDSTAVTERVRMKRAALSAQRSNEVLPIPGRRARPGHHSYHFGQPPLGPRSESTQRFGPTPTQRRSSQESLTRGFASIAASPRRWFPRLHFSGLIVEGGRIPRSAPKDQGMKR